MAEESNLRRAKFPAGSFVRITSTGQLAALSREGRLRFPPPGEQIEYGGEIDSVRRITFSVRGDVLYELEIAPGLWHEELLQRLITYSPLFAHIREALKTIEPSRDKEFVHYPCRAVLKSGDAFDAVYIVAERQYAKQWGVYPENDPRKRWIRIEDIAEVQESPTRLPAQFANEIYRNSESRMGYTVFTVVFSGGLRQACETGYAVDFIHYLSGKSPKDVVAVIAHEARREDALVRSPEWYWCLYSERPNQLIRIVGNSIRAQACQMGTFWTGIFITALSVVCYTKACSAKLRPTGQLRPLSRNASCSAPAKEAEHKRHRTYSAGCNTRKLFPPLDQTSTRAS